MHKSTDVTHRGLYDRRRDGTSIMLSTLLIVLLVVWALGMVSSYTLGGFIHVLLIIAIMAVLIRIIGGRDPLRG